MTNNPVSINGPAMVQQTKDLFGAYYDQTITPKAAITLPEGISVEYADGVKILWSPLLVGGDLVMLPESRVTHVLPPYGQPFAWAYRLPTATKWTITTTDPATNHTASWRADRIIQPLYTGN